VDVLAGVAHRVSFTLNPNPILLRGLPHRTAPR